LIRFGERKEKRRAEKTGTKERKRKEEQSKPSGGMFFVLYFSHNNTLPYSVQRDVVGGGEGWRGN